MPLYQTGALWALTQNGGQNFIVVAPLLLKRHRDFYKGCRNKTGITKKVPNSICKINSPQPLDFFNRGLFCCVLGLLPDRQRLRIDTDG